MIEKEEELIQLIQEQEIQIEKEEEEAITESPAVESKVDSPTLPPPTPQKEEAEEEAKEEVKEEILPFLLEIKSIQQTCLEYNSSRVKKYYRLCLKKLKQINEFLINIQDNFESLNFLIEMSQAEYSFEDLNKVWVQVSQLVMWFSHHRSNLDIFTVKNNNRAFYKYVTQLAKSLKKIFKYQIRAGHSAYRLNKEAYSMDLQDFQAILDMEARQNNIKLSIP